MSHSKGNIALFVVFLFVLILSLLLFTIYSLTPIYLLSLFGVNYTNSDVFTRNFVIANGAIAVISLIGVALSIVLNYKHHNSKTKKKTNNRKIIFISIGLFVIVVIILSVLPGNNSKECSKDQTIEKAKLCTVIIQRDDGGHGTGFSVKQGYVVTNKHVIEGAKSLTTWINGQKELKVWNYSPTFDIAILKSPVDIPTCSWYDSKNLKVTEPLYAVGWPVYSSGEATVTQGIYSRLNTFTDGPEFVQTDAAINPGNSGGPLLNACGVVGINTLKDFWTDERLPRPLEGLGNALSSNMLIPLVENLIKEGKENTSIPQSTAYVRSSSPDVPRSSPTLDISEIQRYLAHLREAKRSWEPMPSGLPKELWDQLIDSFTRQILFCETLLQRLEGGKRPSQDDLYMWDAVVKMSYESSALAKRLNSMQ